MREKDRESEKVSNISKSRMLADSGIWNTTLISPSAYMTARLRPRVTKTTLVTAKTRELVRYPALRSASI